MRDDCRDVLVVGGGPAGAVAAMTLAWAGRSVGLVDPSLGHISPSPSPNEGGEADVSSPLLSASPFSEKGGESGRSSPPSSVAKGGAGMGSSLFKVGESLPPAATLLLRDVGLTLDEWPETSDLIALPGHAPAYGVQSAWGGSVLHTTDFIRDPHGPGWRLDRLLFEAQLRDAAVRAGARVYRGRVAATERGDGKWCVTLMDKSAQSLSACWLVDATGRASSIGRQHGGQRHNADRLVGSVALFAPATDAGRSDEQSMTLVEAVEEGWWYTARLPMGHRVAVYHTDADLPTARLARAADGYVALLSQTTYIQARLPTSIYRLVDGPRVTAANSARLVPPVGNGWLAVGDAALSFDPLSSQGILTALYLGLHAVQALANHLDGEVGALDRYTEQVDRVYAAYQGHYRQYYRNERRWSNSLFWQRRHSSS